MEDSRFIPCNDRVLPGFSDVSLWLLFLFWTRVQKSLRTVAIVCLCSYFSVARCFASYLSDTLCIGSGNYRSLGSPLVSPKTKTLVNRRKNRRAFQLMDYTLSLSADNETADCQIEAVFHSDNSSNLIGMATSPSGTQYAVCTTLQYSSYMPTANCTLLTVEPQSTQEMRQTKMRGKCNTI